MVSTVKTKLADHNNPQEIDSSMKGNRDGSVEDTEVLRGGRDKYYSYIIEYLNQIIPDVMSMIRGLNDVLYYNQSRFDEDVVRDLFLEFEKRIDEVQGSLSENALRYLSDEVAKFKSSQRYKVVFDDRVSLHWHMVNKELRKILHVTGEDRESLQVLGDWGEINNNFSLVMKLSLDHKSFIKVLSLLLKRLNEISQRFPSTVRSLAEDIFNKVASRIRQHDISEETMDTEFADAVFKAYEGVAKPGTQAFRLKAPSSEVVLKWTEKEIVHFWEESGSLRLYNERDRSFLLENPDCFLWLIKQRDVDYNNRKLRACFVGMLEARGFYASQRDISDYWLTLITEHRRLISTPVFNKKAQSIYKNLPGPERVHVVQRIVGGVNALRGIRQNMSERLFIEDRAASSQDKPVATQEDEQQRLIQALRTPSFTGRLHTTGDGSLVLANQGRTVFTPLLPPSEAVEDLRTGALCPSDILTISEHLFKLKIK